MGITGITQEKLAVIAGMSQPQLSKKLRGLQPFDEDDLGRIADHFGLDLPDLYDTSVAVAKMSAYKSVSARNRRSDGPSSPDLTVAPGQHHLPGTPPEPSRKPPPKLRSLPTS